MPVHVHEIVDASKDHDIVVMTTGTRVGLRKLFFGSLAEDIALRMQKPVIVVRAGVESQTIQERA